MLSFKVNISKALDTKKIQKVIVKTDVNILVGFPSGMMHIETFHGGDPKDSEPVETAELAKILSYGTNKIPPRPFLEEGIESRKGEIVKAMQEEARKASNGQKADWNKIGTMAVGAVQEFVRSDHYRSTIPNSQKTIDYKGSDMPLIDGGNMIQSVQFIVQEEK